MKIFELKADIKRPHHYFIAVASRSASSGLNRSGELFLKYGPMYFHHTDIENLRDVAIRTQDKLFPTSQLEALDMYEGLKEKVVLFSMMKVSSKVNLCSLHHFSSEHLIEDDWFASLVKNANKIKTEREYLTSAEIHY